MPDDVPVVPSPTSTCARLAEVALVFARLGFTAFGGPAAHVAMMEREVVRRRRWVSPERFLDMMGAANLIPGPSSSELAVFLGHERAGLLGLLVAGACFVLPAALLSGAIAWAYLRFGALPRVGGVLYGIKPVVIAIVAQAVWRLAPKSIKRSPGLAAIGVGACVLAAMQLDALAILASAGAVSALVRAASTRAAGGDGERLLWLGPAAATAKVPAAAVGLGALFVTFLKLGAVVFGSGYVLVAFLRADLVDRLHWMTEAQLIDAVAVGQVTPGPVFTTATFIGYVLAGVPGAVAATVGIFLPGFLLVAAIRPLVARVRRSPVAGAFLDGVNAASLALMVVVTVQLGRAALCDAVTVLVGAASAVLLLRFEVDSTWLIATGALVGVAAQALR